MLLNAMINSGYNNVWLHPQIKSVNEDGTVAFKDGNVVVADTILLCTGYKYHYPFLDTNGMVIVDGDDNRVGPLFKHVFPPALAPSLCFVGVPWKTVPFPNFELQSKWIAGVLSNRIALPSKEDMMEDVKALYSSLEASGKPKRHTHDISDYKGDYTNWLAAQSGCSVLEERREQIISALFKNWLFRPKTYQDEWDEDDNNLVLKVYEDFRNKFKLLEASDAK